MIIVKSNASVRQRADTLRLVLNKRWKVFAGEDFDLPDVEVGVMGEMPDYADFLKKRKDVARLRQANKDSEILPFFQEPLLTKPQEQHLFRQMNFIKFRLEKLILSLNPTRPNLKKVEMGEKMDRRRNEIKQQLVCCNTRLAAQVLRKYSDYCRTKGLATDLLGEAYLNIVRAVDCFDWRRGFKFSTYATWVLINNFSRDLAGERKFSDHFVTGFDQTIYDDREDNRDERHRSNEESRADSSFRVGKLIGLLNRVEDARKKKVIEEFFGLGKDRKKKTLMEISKDMGLTKERVRQLRERGLEDIRTRMTELNWEMGNAV